MCCKQCCNSVTNNVDTNADISAVVYYFTRYKHMPDRRIETTLAYYDISHYLNDNLIEMKYQNGRLIIKLYTN